jgi:hypothetical protein
MIGELGESVSKACVMVRKRFYGAKRFQAIRLLNTHTIVWPLSGGHEHGVKTPGRGGVIPLSSAQAVLEPA